MMMLHYIKSLLDFFNDILNPKREFPDPKRGLDENINIYGDQPYRALKEVRETEKGKYRIVEDYDPGRVKYISFGDQRWTSGDSMIYVIERQTFCGWKEIDTDATHLSKSSAMSVIDRYERNLKESNCSHPTWKETSVGVGGEMVRGKKCEKCGKLDLNW